MAKMMSRSPYGVISLSDANYKVGRATRQHALVTTITCDDDAQLRAWKCRGLWSREGAMRALSLCSSACTYGSPGLCVCVRVSCQQFVVDKPVPYHVIVIFTTASPKYGCANCRYVRVPLCAHTCVSVSAYART